MRFISKRLVVVLGSLLIASGVARGAAAEPVQDPAAEQAKLLRVLASDATPAQKAKWLPRR